MKFQAHDYQKYCISEMICNTEKGLFLDMGLRLEKNGKTVITLSALNDLIYNRFEVGKVLVIAPKTVAEDTWTREQEKWEHLKLLRVQPVLGTLKKRIVALNTQSDIYVINRENVVWLVDYYKSAWPFDTVVIDELSSFKNPSAKRFKAMKCIRPLIKRVYGLTGTPAPNGLEDLWAQIYLLDQGKRLGPSITSYRREYFHEGARNQNVVYEYRPKKTSEEIIKSKIKDLCISLQAKDYLKMPERIDDVRYAVLDKKTQAMYDEFEREMFLQVNDIDELDAASAAALTNKLLQFCNGAVYREDKSYLEIHDKKLEVLEELLESLNGKPALIFYSFKHDLMRITKLLEKMKLRFGTLKTSDDISKWNNGQLDVLLAHPASAAYGLNLQEGGSHIIWFGLNWSLELYQQANARLYRQGQKEKVFIHHIVIDSGMDVDVMNALEEKSSTQESLLNALKAKIKKVKGGG